MFQALPEDAAAGGGVPVSGHALLHRDALEHLGYFAPPHVGESWLLFSLHLQHVFGGVGRHRWLGEGRDQGGGSGGGGGAAATNDGGEEDEDRDGAPLRFAEEQPTAAGLGGGATSAPSLSAAARPGPLRRAFERSTGARFVDLHRLDGLLVVLKAKSRTTFDGATRAHARFAALHAAGQLAEAWPVLSELVWALEAAERSTDWELRRALGTSMRDAALELQANLLDAFDARATHG